MAELHKGYAAALFELSEELKISAEISEELKELSGIFKKFPEYVGLISSPTLSKKERLNILEEALDNNYNEILTSFVLLMCEKDVIRELSGCAEEYEKLYNESLKSSTAVVHSAVLLTEREKEKLQVQLEKISRRNVTLVCFVDESLIGGITVEIDGKVYDGSLRRRLDGIKKVIDE